MQSLNLIEPGKFRFVEVPEPKAKSGEVRVNVLACGVCGSDIHAMNGKQPFFSYPRRLGHELSVEVADAPEDSHFKAEDRCVVEPYLYCGHCPACRIGKTNCCHNLRVLGIHTDGGHAPHMCNPSTYLHKANDLSIEQAALVEPLAIGAHAVERAKLRPGEPVAILGMGAIGIATALFAKAASANIVVVDVHNERLKFAREKMLFESCIVGNESLGEALKAHFGQFPACIIDATGNAQSMNHCFDFIEHGGRVVFVGLFNGDLQFDDPNFHRREVTLLASRAALSTDFKRVIDLVSSGAIHPSPVINVRLAFADLDSQLPEITNRQGLIKAIIDY